MDPGAARGLRQRFRRAARRRFGIDQPLEGRRRSALLDAVAALRLVPLHKPVAGGEAALGARRGRAGRSEEHTSELQSLMRNSYAVFCLKKKTTYRKTSNR